MASKRSWVLMAPAVAVVGLGGFVAARFWLGIPPRLPPLERQEAPRFDPLPTLAERPPGGPQLTGRVLDQEGKPVGDVMVYARAAGVPISALTDAEGRFELEWPVVDPTPPGSTAEEVEIVLAAWGFPPAVERVPLGTELLELRLPPPEEPTPRLPELEFSSLSGRVVAPAARPVEAGRGFEVWLEPVEASDVLGAAVARRAFCAADGSFQLEELGHGRYRAHVVPSWAAGGSWPDLLDPACSELVHPGATPSELLLPLADGAIRGTLLDLDGLPLEGALILVADAERAERLWPPRTSDSEGTFRVGDLPAGSYRLVISAGEARHEESGVVLAAGVELELALPRLAPGTSR